MTGPDPVATLAPQLQELRGQLARSQGEIGVLRERLEDASKGDPASVVREASMEGAAKSPRVAG